MATRPPARPKRVGPSWFWRLPVVARLRSALADPRRKWLRRGLLYLGVPAFLCLLVATYFWISYARIIDAKLGGEQRPVPRIFGRPFELKAGQGLNPKQLEERLNDVGYAAREKPAEPGEFAVEGNTVTLVPRQTSDGKPRTIKVEFSKGATTVVTKVTNEAGRTVDGLTLEAPLLAALAPGARRRYVPIAAIPAHVINAILAIEDRRFWEHPGVDPIGTLRALVTNIKGDKPYLEGGSTLTQQIVKNTFLTPAKSYWRKVQEQFMSVVLESRLTKQQILEVYLNDVVLGQRGPFEIRGVAEAARIFFGKDISNVTLAEAATIAGIIQTPSRLSPFRNPERTIERRNLVLNEMVDTEYITRDEANRAIKMPLGVNARALENEAPYFVDYVSQLVDEKYAGLLRKESAVDVYTTLDLHLQRFAQEAVADGTARLEKALAGKKRQGEPQIALLAVDPRDGEVLAYVGGLAYSQTQLDRVIKARRQPGSVFKPFVYLAAFEKMAAEGRDELTPATIETDEPTTFKDGENDYAPANYQNEYDGPITLRQALAHSRNIVAIKVAGQTGYDRVANLWQQIGVGTPAKPYPSIALGVFEATPFDLATAYTVFPNGGLVRPLHAISRIVTAGNARTVPPGDTKLIARSDTTFLVTNMMRSVLNEGTAAGARGQGFQLDAAGKTGTTNDLRDAWFIGFTPELLTVVWVGYDNNQPIGLSGSQAALPIWTTFMKRALAARPNRPFSVPEGVTFALIDRDTGKLALSTCPRTINESFLVGTQPREYCNVHATGLAGAFRKLGGFFRRIIR
jgi:penicillin-binding protein 1B